MCDCIKDIENKTIEMVVAKNEGGVLSGKIIHSHWPIVEGSFKERITYSLFEYDIIPIKKDGTEGKRKTKRLSISHSYCPFCGKKHD